MKHLIFAIFLMFSAALFAQEEEAVMPEPSQPPFEVGALPVEGGYTIERDGLPNLNFRIVDSKIRIYWIDEDGLIAEPDVDMVVVRFTGSVRGRAYHQLQKLSGDVGLGSSFNVLRPHLYNVLVVVRVPDAEEPETYHFRYTPAMSGDA
jgi:hypothetical protein